MTRPLLLLTVALLSSPALHAQQIQRQLGDFDFKLGTTPSRIVDAVNAVLARPPQPARFDPDASPYGDGRASARIVAALRGAPLPEFSPGVRSSGAVHPIHAK